KHRLAGPIPEELLHDIAEESSQSERRADDAERALPEWKKIKFMEERIGEEFAGLIVSVTEFGFFVELLQLFIEGLVPLATLEGGTWLSLVEHALGVRGVGSSNLPVPTNRFYGPLLKRTVSSSPGAAAALDYGDAWPTRSPASSILITIGGNAL